MTATPFQAQVIRSVLNHPAIWLMSLIYVISAGVFVIVCGDVVTLFVQFGVTLWTLVCAIVAILLTSRPTIAWKRPPAISKFKLRLQLEVITLVILYTVYCMQTIQSPELENVPIW